MERGHPESAAGPRSCGVGVLDGKDRRRRGRGRSDLYL